MATLNIRVVADVAGIEGAAERVDRALAQTMPEANAQVIEEARRRVPKRTRAAERSITGEVRVAGGVVRGYVGPKVHYGGYLEWGTRYMRPRPYLNPALAARESAILLLFERAVQGVL
jgi:HK97 gp10 family phage protein